MEIFGKHLFGSCAQEFIVLPIIEQVPWIKKRTKQTNDDLIDDFLSNIKGQEDKQCINCGNDGNITSRIPEEATTVIKATNDSVDNGRNSTKRPKATKRGKNK